MARSWAEAAKRLSPMPSLNRPLSSQHFADIDRAAFALQWQHDAFFRVYDDREAPHREEHAEVRIEQEVAPRGDESEGPARQIRDVRCAGGDVGDSVCGLPRVDRGDTHARRDPDAAPPGQLYDFRLAARLQAHGEVADPPYGEGVVDGFGRSGRRAPGRHQRQG